MTLPPQINATLSEIAGHGFSEDDDTPAGVPTAKWQGDTGVFINEELISGFNPTGALNRTMQTTMYFDDELAIVELGDVVTYTYRGEVFTRRVANLTGANLPGAPSYGVAVLENVGAS